MAEGFTRKKVASLTLGEKLRKLRADFRMSLQDVSKVTRIQVKYLESLESGQYEKLPADVYVRGFLRSYARYLNVDEQALVKLYERERNIQANLGLEVATKTGQNSFAPLSFVITSRTLFLTGIIIVVSGAFFYLYQEFQSFAAEPQLTLLEPENGALVDSQDVRVRGKTDKGATVTLNDQAVFVDNEGTFSDMLPVRFGMNTIVIRTVNRFEKEKKVILSVESRFVPIAPSPSVEPETSPTDEARPGQ
ncbi:MAG: helix-turn-helix domain-containing protein [Candidatus Moranbacteria bacterium]|jgi:cytoskeletal protein RodZ|nr:helix-turn-helix domain-containing protein [Candidatus Moranbacteria bacterium]